MALFSTSHGEVVVMDGWLTWADASITASQPDVSDGSTHCDQA
jgi:hypothetical protein